jgi:hypothetical protein
MESFWRAVVSALRRKGGFRVSIVSANVSALKQTADRKNRAGVFPPRPGNALYMWMFRL